LTFPVGPSDLIIGKGRRCDVRLNDPLLSAKHCGISHEGPRPLLWDMQSTTGIFVNGFYFYGKILLHADRIRVGRSIFVYLDRSDAEVDPGTWTRTAAEEEWDRKLQSGRSKAAYEPELSTVLDAFLDFNGRINALRDASEIQSQVFELIFRLMPVEGVAILLADHDGDERSECEPDRAKQVNDGVMSTTYRRIGSPGDDSFPLDDALTEKALRDGVPTGSDKAVCLPLLTAGTKVGLIYAAMATAGAEFFTSGHMRLLQAVAGSTAVALEHARYVAWLEGENRRLKEAIKVEHDMAGRSARMQQVYDLISRAGPSDLTVLITGESGTGKELAAKALHRNSPRSQKEMYVANCAAFTDTLLGSELFGHEKGAYTGADQLQKGIFEFADGGTVFLDEVGECSAKLQGDLLRLLQQGEFKRLGSNRVLHTNVRIIAATNVDLEKAIKEGRFRQDLYYRLNKILIHMPRLAERRDDIPIIVAELIKKHGHIRPGPRPRVRGVTPEVRQIFASYDWPGNVRELETVIEVAIALGTSAYIGLEDLPASFASDAPQQAELGLWVTELDACKKAIVERALQKTAGNRAEAARLLGSNPKYFSALCKELKVKPE
jgi:DNA-binding NtrC family response regulator